LTEGGRVIYITQSGVPKVGIGDEEKVFLTNLIALIEVGALMNEPPRPYGEGLVQGITYRSDLPVSEKHPKLIRRCASG
jgi:hypothetical protein